VASTRAASSNGVEFLKNDTHRTTAAFDSGKLRAFGDAQDDVLKQFQRVRQLQVALSLKQVAMLGDDKEHSEHDIDELTRRLTEIASEMESFMRSPTLVAAPAQPSAPTAANPTTVQAARRGPEDVKQNEQDDEDEDAS